MDRDKPVVVEGKFSTLDALTSTVITEMPVSCSVTPGQRQ